MSYVQKVLQPGEEVRYHASIHWIAYVHGTLWLAVAATVWMVAPVTWRDGYVVKAIMFVLFAGGLFWLARAWFEWWITEIAVTDRRVIYKRGLISRTTSEMHMDKIESVNVEQSILGRILDFGEVTMRGHRHGDGVVLGKSTSRSLRRSSCAITSPASDHAKARVRTRFSA